MAYRLACDASDIFAGVIAVDGPPPEDNWKAGYRCEPSNPINVLHVHGTLDAVVGYDGLLQTWTQKNPYKGAVDSAEMFARFNRCPQQGNTMFPWEARDKSATGQTTWDLSDKIDGLDTEVFRITACAKNSSVELWKIVGEDHFPDLSQEYVAKAMQWILSHGRSKAISERPRCLDHPLAWKDSQGKGCQYYAHHNWCTGTGDYGAGWPGGSFQDFAADGKSAKDVCCSCGGGLPGDVCTNSPRGWATTTTSDTLSFCGTSLLPQLVLTLALLRQLQM